MPMFDLHCYDCDASKLDVLEHVQPTLEEDARRACRCGGRMERAWIEKPANVVGDECDIVQENGFRHPRRFRSKAELRRALAEQGKEIRVEHTPVPGSDKSPHTQSWAATGGVEWLKNAEILATRNGGASTDGNSPNAVRVQWTVRELAE